MSKEKCKQYSRETEVQYNYFFALGLKENYRSRRWQAPGAVKKEKKIVKKSEKNPKKNQKNRASAYICFCRLRAKSRI